MSGASSEGVDDTVHVRDTSPAEKRVTRGSTVSLATNEVAVANAGREPRGEVEGGGVGGEGRGGFSLLNRTIANKGWARGFLLSSSRQTSGGAPTGKVISFNIP